jgi:16S rRNA (cytosine967-C5)-methyltransferase
LRAVDERDAYANLVLPSLLRERRITGRDAHFATELAYGTLRGRGTYDEVIAACSSRPLADIDPPVLDLLRLGAHQLLSMRVPPHAAVASTVDIVTAISGRRATGFVNAILRSVAVRDYDGWMAALAPAYEDDPVGHIAMVHMHPRWIVDVLREAMSGDLEETARACAANNVAAPVHLVARPGRIDRDDLLARAGPDARPGRWSPYAVHLADGDPGAIDAVRSGRAGVQDEGSQLAALALIESVIEGPDRRWLDLCAGPGGKTALLAAASGPGVHVVANDRSVHRSRLVSQTVAGLARASVVTADGTKPPWPDETFDRVLVDAPCTGLGALRRRPETRWRRQQEDADRLHPLQVALLEAAVASVRPGGLVAYVTCSPDRRETDAVVTDVLNRRSVETISVPLPVVMPSVATGRQTGAIQLWPHRQDTDAMYITVLRRIGQTD